MYGTLNISVVNNEIKRFNFPDKRQKDKTFSVSSKAKPKFERSDHPYLSPTVILSTKSIRLH